MGAYLIKLEEEADVASLRIMSSNGGSISPARAADEAVTTILSGPAAGVVASRRLGAVTGNVDVISFDMGGTSTDVSLIPGKIQLTGETNLAGNPIRTPAIDIHTVGAGGGSSAWIDPGGVLKGGPQSAGAEPGPACYGRGGPVTVTDANLVLGRLIAERFLDGGMELDRNLSRRGIQTLADELGMGLEETASGVVEVANITMARAIREVSLFRGHDPSGFLLCAFGGAGGLHAANLAEAAGTSGALIPPEPGVFSAWGLLAGDLMVSRSATVLQSSDRLHGEVLERAFAPMEQDALCAIQSESGNATTQGEIRIERMIDARYSGQSHEISISAGGDWVASFHDAHHARFGFDNRKEAVVAVTLRIRARASVPPPPYPEPWSGSSRPGAGHVPARPARIWDAGKWHDGQAVERSGMAAGSTLAGPAVITEAGATTFVPARCSASVTSEGALRIQETS